MMASSLDREKSNDLMLSTIEEAWRYCLAAIMMIGSRTRKSDGLIAWQREPCLDLVCKES